jgi:signal transduction histidine kinase
MHSALAGLPGQRRPDEQGPDLPSAVLRLAEADADAAADALHDGALQALVVARYAADAAVRGGDPAVARDAVQEALVALRRAVWLLRPRGEQGLLEALQQLAAQVVQTGGAPVELDVDDTDASALDAGLSPAAATAAYRLVQRAAGDVPLTVRVRRTATGLRIALDVPLSDPAGEALRARAVGGALLATRDGASLHLPLSRPLTPLHAVRPEVLR